MTERLRVVVGDSEVSPIGRLFISARAIDDGAVATVIGRTGYENVGKNLYIGDVVTFETRDDTYEIRVMRIITPDDQYRAYEVDYLVTSMNSHGDDAAKFDGEDNTPFTAEERARIAENLEEIRLEMSKRADMTRDSLAYITRKLKALEEASERLGRKDWTLLVVGLLVTLGVENILGADIATALGRTAQSVMSWVFVGLPALPSLGAGY